MKKVLILLAATIAFASCSSMGIAINKVTPKGERTILTNNQHLFNYDWATIEVALGERIYLKDSTYAVVITCNRDTDHGIFDKNDRLMIRLTDSTEITLSNMYHHEYQVTEETHVTQDPVMNYGYVYSPWTGLSYLTPYAVTTYVPRVYHEKKSESFALYIIKKKDILNIINKGVIKLRVEVEDADMDMQNPENAASVFAALYDCLKACAAEQVRKSSF